MGKSFSSRQDNAG